MSGCGRWARGRASRAERPALHPLAESLLAALGGHTGPLLVAASGGPDSTALALLAAEALRGRPGAGPLVLAHVHHGVHSEADRAAAFVRTLAVRCGAQHAERRLTLGASERSEQAMREQRYAALVAIAREARASMVWTAHHADDNLETLLFRLQRGTGPRGLCGIRPERELAAGVRVVRPLLRVRKRTLTEYLQAQGIEPVDDPTNADRSKARNAVRLELLPALRGRHGAAIEANLFALLQSAAATAAVLRAHTAEYLQAWLHRPLPWRAELGVPAAGPARPFLADAVQSVHESLAAGGTPPWSWVERVLELQRSPAGTRVAAASPVTVERTRDGLLFVVMARVPLVPERPVGLPADGSWQRFGGSEWRIRCRAQEPAAAAGAAVVDPVAAPTPWGLRRRRAGDRFQPLGSAAPVDLRRFLQGRHVPRFDRERMPLLVDAEDRILWVPGVEIAEPLRVHAGTVQRTTLEWMWD